jgi:hypothetical protein
MKKQCPQKRSAEADGRAESSSISSCHGYGQSKFKSGVPVRRLGPLEASVRSRLGAWLRARASPRPAPLDAWGQWRTAA